MLKQTRRESSNSLNTNSKFSVKNFQQFKGIHEVALYILIAGEAEANQKQKLRQNHLYANINDK